MKNIFVLFLSIFVITLFSTQSFAAVSASTAGNSTTNGKIVLGVTSPTVTINLSANDTASYFGSDSDKGKTYAAITHNPNGAGVEYGTASDTSNIMQQPNAGATATALTAGDSAQVTSGNWTPVGS